MQGNPQDPREFLKQIPDLLPKFCDKCGTRHVESDLEQISTEGNKSTFKLECKSCKNTYLFHISSPLGGVLSAKRFPFKPTITSKELKKFADSEIIDDNEVLDIYTNLKSVGTIDDFNRLFQ